MRVLVLVPTYNELEALPVTMDALLQAAPDVEVLIIDDASPDGTGRLADAMAAAEASKRAPDSADLRVICTLNAGLADVTPASLARALCTSPADLGRGGFVAGGVALARGVPTRVGAE